jgi:uncharacterized protein YecT (DUF1311 family)
MSFGVLVFSPSMVQAQGHSLYCGQADSTAATQNCLKRHLDIAQRRLNKIYKKLNNKLEADKKAELAELQKSWLTYRDAECMWEAENSETVSLKHINELSCMARVSEDRANILSVIYNDEADQENVREYGSFPRWMNVVTKDNSNVYWDYGQRAGFDLDCDGVDEYVMQGVELKQVKNTAVKEGDDVDILPQNYNKTVVVSISQNPSTGRPSTQVFKFLVSPEESGDKICHGDVKIKFTKAVEVEKKEGEEEVSACTAKLELKTKGCDPKTISWTDTKFVLEVPTELTETKKKK